MQFALILLYSKLFEHALERRRPSFQKEEAVRDNEEKSIETKQNGGKRLVKLRRPVEEKLFFGARK